MWRGRPFLDIESWPIAEGTISELLERRRLAEEQVIADRLADGSDPATAARSARTHGERGAATGTSLGLESACPRPRRPTI